MIGTRHVAAAVRDYEDEYRGRHEDALDYYRNLCDLATVIEQATLARDANDKKHPHQWRLRNAVLRRTADNLRTRETELGEATSFDTIMRLIEESAATGFGPLAVYDTATRIGAWLKIAPDRVCLHAGTRRGAAALGLDATLRSVAPDDLPESLRHLTPDHIENFLCIYKDALYGDSKQDSPRLSPCAVPRRRKPARC